MFKSATIYRYQAEAESLARADFAQFVPCSDLQEKSVGWVEPRGVNHGPMIEVVGGERIVKLMIETKTVPGNVLRGAVEDRIYEIEQSQGRKPGKKEIREIKEDVRMALLPQAFPKQTAVFGWLRDDGFLVIDTTSQSKADDFVTALIQAIPSIKLYAMTTAIAPQGAMIDWILGDHIDLPYGLSIGRDCVLESIGDDLAKVKFTHHNLDCKEIRNHVSEGKLPTSLALTWSDQIDFTLTDGLRLKKINILDAGAANEEGDAFDGDVAIMTGVLGNAINAVILALGGEMK